MIKWQLNKLSVVRWGISSESIPSYPRRFELMSPVIREWNNDRGVKRWDSVFYHFDCRTTIKDFSAVDVLLTRDQDCGL